MAVMVAAQAAAFSFAKAPATSCLFSRLQSSSSSVSSVAVGGQGSHIAIYPMRTTSIRRNSSPEKTTSLALSPASAAAFFVRGGAIAADAAVLKNFYGDALGFFGGIRIPATFLAGSSLAAIFTLKNEAVSNLSSSGDNKSSALERRMMKFYHLVSFLAFILSLNTIMTATSAHTSILHGRFDQMAETAYMLMKREFEYEFVSVRWSFFMSIFCFLGMITSRVLIEFGLLEQSVSGSGKEKSSGRRDVAMLVVFSVGALASNLMSYINSTLYCWRNLTQMTVYLAQLLLKCAFVEQRPLQVVSMICTLASIVFVGKLVVNDLKGDDDEKKQ
eukprot:CAMPEP_0183739446 /NCGR_PEP_ID=MMETSP0737-20130205/57056_1 /TAXON_ID=385413 /ORGANISM="Thalassiosira miniscula, Strain CCMP1093" /LENGTH=330 /DNA_ID=CAMNT_0025974247 /DNA_START=34 /DNA_END=1026 /DNA_ORIENTATION=-